VVIAPKDNEKDMEDIPHNVKRDIKFHFVKRLDEVLSIALGKWPIATLSGADSLKRNRLEYLIN
jgi:ATP-dependent Lon protease